MVKTQNNRQTEVMGMILSQSRGGGQGLSKQMDFVLKALGSHRRVLSWGRT